jgi:hypothetical protein
VTALSIHIVTAGYCTGHPEIYAAAMCYKVDITIYSKDYAELGGSLVFTLTIYRSRR